MQNVRIGMSGIENMLLGWVVGVIRVGSVWQCECVVAEDQLESALECRLEPSRAIARR